MKRKTLSIATACLLANSPTVASALEETDRYGKAFVTYAQVDRPDGSYRRMLTTQDVLDAAHAGQPLPEGARILMETYNSPGALGTVFHKRKTERGWEYGSFAGQGIVDLSTRPQASCLSCHARAAETDFTFTKSALGAALRLGEIALFCSRGGRAPCALDVYQIDPAQ